MQKLIAMFSLSTLIIDKVIKNEIYSIVSSIFLDFDDGSNELLSLLSVYCYLFCLMNFIWHYKICIGFWHKWT